MKNKEMKNPMELEDDALDTVGGGFAPPIIVTLPNRVEMKAAPGKKEICASCPYAKSDRDTSIFGKLLGIGPSEDICKNCPYEDQEKNTKVTL